VVRGVFEDAYNYMKSGQLMRQVINKIQEGVDFNKAQERHAFGDMYEQLLRDLQNAGNAGEFYTPRPVTEFMVRMVDPKLDEKVMDPACGTGGFLTCTIEHKRQRYVKTPDGRARPAGQHPRRGEEAAAAPAGHHQHDPARHRGAQPDPPRQHPGPPAHQLGAERPGGLHRCQPALRRHGRRRHRDQLPRRLPHPGNGRPVPGADHAPAQRRAAAPPWCCPTASCLAKASRAASRKSC
jgi:hypothetical protein